MALFLHLNTKLDQACTVKFFMLIGTLFFVGSCARGQGISMHPYALHKDSYNNFRVCHGFSCTMKTETTITTDQWNTVLEIFNPPAQNAEIEQQNIAQAIGMIEEIVRTNTNMSIDHAKAENFETDQDQMDCIDETVNTTRYLSFLEKEGVFKWHTVSDPLHRGYFIDWMWPHNSAAIKQNDTGTIYAVDSYYRDNGQPAYIIRKKIWLDDWKPTSHL